MALLQKIKDIEKELERTQRNKATEHHFGMMKAKLVFFSLSLNSSLGEIQVRIIRTTKKRTKRRGI